MNSFSQPIQGSLQHAVAQQSKSAQVIEATLAVAGDKYLNCSDLIQHPDIRPLVRDLQDLSIILSEANRRKRVGRIYLPNGRREMYGYGRRRDGAPVIRPATEPEAPPAQVIRPVVMEAPAPAYMLSVQCKDAVEVLALLQQYPGSVFVETASGWGVSVVVADARAALDFLIAGDFICGVDLSKSDAW